MALLARFSAIINLKADERRSFRYLFLLTLTTGISTSMYFVSVYTFLIKKSSASNLPFVYIISGLVGVLLIRLYQVRQRKTGIVRSYREAMVAFIVITLIVFSAFMKFGGNAGYAVYLAYFGFLFQTPFTIIFALSFSAICSRLYNLSQSKRLLALIGIGETLASITGYLIAPMVSKLTGSPDYLLLVSAFFILPALVPLYRLTKDNAEKLSHLPTAKAALKKLNLAFFRSERFYLLIGLASIFSVSAMYFVDYSYMIAVRFMASFSGVEIAVIVGLFFSTVRMGELVFSFLSGHILSSKGVKFAILLLPALLSGCFIFAAAGGFVFSGVPVFILSFILLSKFVERAIRKTIFTPAVKVLYQVTGSDRLRIEATIEGVLNQVAAVLSGVLLVIFSSLFSKAEPMQYLSIISVICAVIFLGWSAVSFKLYENYRKKIWAYLREMRSANNAPAAAPEIDFTLPDGGLLAGQPVFDSAFEKAKSTVSRAKISRDLGPLEIYSNSAFNQVLTDDPVQVRKKLVNSYYSNDNFFYRLSVIRYFQSEEEEFPQRLFREFWEISDLALKLELISAFNKYGEKPQPADSFYFEDLCHQYSNELILVLSAQHDLRNIEDPALQEALQWQINQLIRVLFGLLKVLYDHSAIQVIYEIITADDHQDIESKLFALELLDTTLNDDLKSRLIPIFEPVEFDQKLGKLQQFVPVEPLSPEKQLKNLLMKDFGLVNPHLKEICLTCYFRLTGDMKVIGAFQASAIRNLQHLAGHLVKHDENMPFSRPALLDELEKAFSLNPVQLNYLYNQGTQPQGLKKDRQASSSYRAQVENPYHALISSKAGNVLLDTYALALLVDNSLEIR